MARIRTIKPEFFTSLTIADLSIEARLTFVGLWTHVDDQGRCVDDARLIKAALWPLDDRVSADVEGDLRALTESSLILRYKVGGRSYLAVRSWDEHQRINRPTKSKLPPPPAGSPSPPPGGRQDDDASPQPAETPSWSATHPQCGESSPTAHARLSEDSLQERNREQGTGNREQTHAALAPLDASAASDAEVIEAELVEEPTAPPALFAVPDPAPGTDLAHTDTENAGLITKQWLDYCTGRDVKLPTRTIKRYAAGIKAALDQGFEPELIKRALADMLRDHVVARPSLMDNYLVRAQTGPERPPARMTRTEAAATRGAPPGTTLGDMVRDALTRPA